jgi:hypothetical protein
MLMGKSRNHAAHTFAAGVRRLQSGMDHRLLELYLADHLAAATAGVALVRRSAQSNSGNETGEFLARLGAEIAADRNTLRRIVAALDFEPSKAKQLLAWVGERAGRLKSNGRLFSYSPLSRLLELEMLSVGIAGKLALWQSLLQVPALEQQLASFDLTGLAQRAAAQRAEVEQHRLRAVRQAFGSR